MKVDSKGRISIPAWLRRNFLLKEGSDVAMLFDMRENAVLLVFDGITSKQERRECPVLLSPAGVLPSSKSQYGRDCVTASTEGCEPSSPGSIPGLGPSMRKEVAYGRLW